MPATLVLLCLVVWVGATIALVRTNRVVRFLWLPTFLALIGVFTSLLPLVLDPAAATAVNVLILVPFVASLAVLPDPRVGVSHSLPVNCDWKVKAGARHF